jgi:hypothetical protein
MRAIARSAAVSAIALLWCLPGPAQTRTVYFSEPVLVGARALSFARAVVGDNPDVTALYGNPAALSYLENSSIILTHTLEQSTNVMDENIAVPLFLRRGEVVGIAASVNHVGYATQDILVPFKVMQYGYDVAYSRRIIPKLSLGGTLNVRYAKSSASKVWGLSGGFGIFYYPTPDISYGMSINGIGSGIKYIYNGAQTLLNSESIPRKLYLGSVWHFPTKTWKRNFLNMSVACEKNYEIKGVFYFGGVEFLPTEFVALRVGYLGGPDHLNYPSYGVGILMNGWKLDIGTTPAKAAGEVIQVSISAPIWNQLDGIN